MKDFNFFSGYTKTRERGHKRAVLFISAAALLLFAGFCAFTVYYTFELRLRAIRFQVGSNLLYTTSQDTIEKLKQHDELTTRLSDIEAYNSKVYSLTESLMKSSVIKTGLITGISDKIPKDTSIDTMTISDGMVTISGTSEKEISIAEFEHNLRGLDTVGGVFVNGISGSSGEFAFTMSIAIKEAPVNVWD